MRRRFTPAFVLVLLAAVAIPAPGRAATPDTITVGALVAGPDVPWMHTVNATLNGTAVASTLEVDHAGASFTMSHRPDTQPRFSVWDVAPVRLDQPVTVTLDPADARRYTFTLPGYRVRFHDEPGVVTGRIGPGATAEVSARWPVGTGAATATRIVTGDGATGAFVADLRAGPGPGETGQFGATAWPPGTSVTLSVTLTDPSGAELRVALNRMMPAPYVRTTDGDRTDAFVGFETMDLLRPVTFGGAHYVSGLATIIPHVDLTTPGLTFGDGRFTWPVPDADFSVVADHTTRSARGTAPPGATVDLRMTDPGGSTPRVTTTASAAGQWSYSWGGAAPAWMYVSGMVRTGPGSAQVDDDVSGNWSITASDVTATAQVRDNRLNLSNGGYLASGTPLTLEVTSGGTAHTVAGTWETGLGYGLSVSGDDFTPSLDLAGGGSLSITTPHGTVGLTLPRLLDVEVTGSAVQGTTEPNAQVVLRLFRRTADTLEATITADGSGAFRHDFGVAPDNGDTVTARVSLGPGSVDTSDIIAYPTEAVIPSGAAGTVYGRQWGPRATAASAPTERTLRIGNDTSRWDTSAPRPDPETTAAPLSMPYTLELLENGVPVHVPTGRIDLDLPLGAGDGSPHGSARVPDFPFVGFDAGHGWETVPPDRVTWCVDPYAPDLAGICNTFPMPFARISPLPHASTFMAFADNPAGPLDVARAAGPTRVETALELSAAAFTTADTVVVATSQAFPDALAAAPLAAAHEAPVLLNPQTALLSDVAAEVDRLGATRVFVMGGAAALADEVVTALRARPGVAHVERVAGPDRFATAAEAAYVALAGWQQAGFTEVGHEVIVALGAYPGDDTRAWPDALAAGPLAAAAHMPILLTTPDVVPEATRDALDLLPVTDVLVVGGTGAIPDATMNRLGPDTVDRDRIGGTNRYHTSVLLAEEAVREGATSRELVLATGQNWPDGLAAGPAVAARGGVLLLAPQDALTHVPSVRDWLDAHADVTRWVRLAGATGALSDTVLTGVRNHLD